MKSPVFPAFIPPGSAPGFPPDASALHEPNGLIAIGGDLATERLLAAYRRGIFPWYEEGQPILWWTPDPRCVLRPAELHISRSLRRSLRRKAIEVTRDQAFGRVIRACAEPREPGGGTWITEEMMHAYNALHAGGHAHSFEVWRDGDLIGGLYGVAIGAAFFGESMFSREPDASKTALVALCEKFSKYEATLVDCQVVSNHLLRLGAEIVPRARFRVRLAEAIAAPAPFKST
jgi:leucyl/phenylalanyl-tRNA--protein transferase